jgi:hypothetical protein
MTYVSAEFVKTKQKINDAKFWKVFDQTGKSLVDKCDQDIGLSASIDMLQETLDECMGEFVIVKLYSKQPERRELGTNAETGLTLKVKLNSNPGYNQKSTYSSGIGQISLTDYMTINDKNRQLELDKLRMELEQDKQESPMMAALYKALENPESTLRGIGAMIAMVMNKNQISSPDNSIINEVQSLGIDMIDLQKVIGRLKQNPDSAKAFADGIKKMANEESN